MTVRVLHTADWHVGKTVRGRSRADEHEAVLAEIAAIAAAERAHLVLVVGDLFDTAAPTPEAERIVYAALLELADGGHRPVVVVAGNHDNARRLEAVAPLLALGGVHVQGHLAAPDQGGVIHLDVEGDDGPVPVQVALVPFPSQRYIVRADDLMGLEPAQHAQRYEDRIRRVVAALTAGFGPDTVNLVAAHLMVTGGVLGGGERSAHTIFDYAVGTPAFPPTAHYVALGHLHRPQSLPGPCPVWYSGSPLQMDFGEGADDKSVQLLEARPGAPATVRSVPLRSGRRFRTVSGTLASLAELVDEVGDDYLRVAVDEKLRVGLADEVRELFANAVEVTVVSSPEPGAAVEPGTRVGRTPRELFVDYLAERGVDDDRLVGLFDALLDEATADDADAELVWAADAGGDDQGATPSASTGAVGDAS